MVVSRGELSMGSNEEDSLVINSFVHQQLHAIDSQCKSKSPLHPLKFGIIVFGLELFIFA